jgi:hypothetical protein
MLRSRRAASTSCNTWSIASATLSFSAGSGWIPLTARQACVDQDRRLESMMATTNDSGNGRGCNSVELSLNW